MSLDHDSDAVRAGTDGYPNSNLNFHPNPNLSPRDGNADTHPHHDGIRPGPAPTSMIPSGGRLTIRTRSAADRAHWRE